MALEAPRRDRRVVDRAVEREVHLDVPLEPVDRGPLPPICRFVPSASPTSLAMTFQWPGGVSDFGPSAQNSVSARHEVAVVDDIGLVRLAGDRVDRHDPSRRSCPAGCCPEHPARCRSSPCWPASSRLLSRITSTAWSLYVVARSRQLRRRPRIDRDARRHRRPGCANAGHVAPVRPDGLLDAVLDRDPVLGDHVLELEWLPAVGVGHRDPGASDDERLVDRRVVRVGA